MFENYMQKNLILQVDDCITCSFTENELLHIIHMAKIRNYGSLNF